MTAVGAVRGGADRQALPQSAATLQGIAQRRGKKIATTAVAPKLLTRAWHLLTDAELTAALKSAPRPRTGDAVTGGGGRQAPGELADHPEPATPRSKI